MCPAKRAIFIVCSRKHAHRGTVPCLAQYWTSPKTHPCRSPPGATAGGPVQHARRERLPPQTAMRDTHHIRCPWLQQVDGHSMHHEVLHARAGLTGGRRSCCGTVRERMHTSEPCTQRAVASTSTAVEGRTRLPVITPRSCTHSPPPPPLPPATPASAPGCTGAAAKADDGPAPAAGALGMPIAALICSLITASCTVGVGVRRGALRRCAEVRRPCRCARRMVSHMRTWVRAATALLWELRHVFVVETLVSHPTASGCSAKWKCALPRGMYCHSVLSRASALCQTSGTPGSDTRCIVIISLAAGALGGKSLAGCKTVLRCDTADAN